MLNGSLFTLHVSCVSILNDIYLCISFRIDCVMLIVKLKSYDILLEMCT